MVKFYSTEFHVFSHLFFHSASVEMKCMIFIVFFLYLICHDHNDLLSGAYLVVITKKKLVGLVNDHEVWKMLETDILPFPRATLHLTEGQVLI